MYVCMVSYNVFLGICLCGVCVCVCVCVHAHTCARMYWCRVPLMYVCLYLLPWRAYQRDHPGGTCETFSPEELRAYWLRYLPEGMKGRRDGGRAMSINDTGDKQFPTHQRIPYGTQPCSCTLLWFYFRSAPSMTVQHSPSSHCSHTFGDCECICQSEWRTLRSVEKQQGSLVLNNSKIACSLHTPCTRDLFPATKLKTAV